ncbi:MAG: hypothetical protein COA65_07495 [Rhodospirillaceae bacterium]|nr:MAG: hypothetical protein COA65_07495 [Rhodospirillaceae bacterium]
MLARWVGVLLRRARTVVLTAIAVTIGLLIYTVETLGINTQTTDMLSPDLPFRKNAEAIKSAFPQYSDVILAVIDGENPDQVDAVAEELAERLRAQPAFFRTVFHPASDPYFKKYGLLYLDSEALNARALQLSQAQPFLGTLSRHPDLGGLFDMLGLAIDRILKEKKPEKEDKKKTEGLKRLLNHMAAVVETLPEEQARSLSWKKIIEGEELATNGRQFIVIQPVLDFSTLAPANAAMNKIRDLAATLAPRGDIRLRLTGSAALEQAELQSIQEGIGLVGLISVSLVTGLLLIGLGSARVVVAAILTLIMGLIWSLAFAAFAIGHLNLISVAFAVLFVGLSVDFGIHFSLRFREEIERGEAPLPALEAAVKEVGGALTFCAIAAAIGFYAFLPTDYLGVAELGLIAGTSMFIALFANLTVLPALLALMPPRRSSFSPGRPFDFAKIVRRHARRIVMASSLLAILGCAALPFARFDFNPLNLQNPDSEAMRTFKDLLKTGDIDPYAITVLTKNIDVAAALKKKLSELPEVGDVIIPQDLVPKNQEDALFVLDDLSIILLPVLMGNTEERKQTNEDRREQLHAFRKKIADLAKIDPSLGYAKIAGRLADAFQRADVAFPERGLPTKRLEKRLLGTLPMQLDRLRTALGAQPVTFATLPEELRARFVAKDSRARVEVRPATDLKDPQALRRFVTAVQAVAPNATGDPIVMIGAVEAVIDAFWQATLLALALITILLAIVLRRASDVLLVLAPLGLAMLLTNLFAVLLDLPLNFANVIVLPLLLGLGVANGIHFVLRERNNGGDGDVLHTSTLRAILFSALTTIGSFASLSLSTHVGTASMGMLLTIALILVMACTLTLIPALIAIRRKDA